MTSDRRIRKKAQVRRRIMDEAFGLFAQKGLYAPKIEDITEAADLGKGTFYLYFPSRDSLVAALVHEGTDKLMELLSQEVEALGDGEGAERALIHAHARFFQEYPNYLTLFHQARGWLKLPSGSNAPIREEFMRYLDLLADLLGKTPRGKSVSREERQVLARTMAGCIAGMLSFDIVAHSGPADGEEIIGRLSHLGCLFSEKK